MSPVSVAMKTKLIEKQNIAPLSKNIAVQLVDVAHFFSKFSNITGRVKQNLHLKFFWATKNSQVVPSDPGKMKRETVQQKTLTNVLFTPKNAF